jgi:3'-phosphoadenosine 5'-phosphosulfate (PAPS) 3'-phosphatase
MNDVGLAEHIATVAGKLLLELQQSGLFDGKALGKAGDRTANAFIMEALKSQRPDDAILSESVPDQIVALHSFLSMRRTEAQRKNVRAFLFRHSQSLARRRQRLSQPMVRSTTHRLGSTAKPCTASDRFTISIRIFRSIFLTACRNLGPR